MGAKRADVVQGGLALADAVEELDQRRQSTTRGHGEICRIYASGTSGVDELAISWHLTDKVRTPAPDFIKLPMGEQAGAAWDTGYVIFACADDTGAPGASPDHVGVFVESNTPVPEPLGEAKALRNAYATMAHSFALSMAKGLGCADSAGLPAKPVLIP
ncbi:hypothetical protein ACWGRF_35350 [Streptomyces zhihengii]|uniref:hypothetical protein n=1 Tax=Streptomyces zhihengii TaxID=1818004 RepID=UPI003635D594